MLKYISTLFLLLSSLVPLHAQKTDSLNLDSALLSEVVVTYQAKQLTPFTFYDLGQAAIQNKSTGQEPAFLLAQTPSITAYSDAGNTQGYSYIRLRGIDQTRINITLDGVPLNEPEDQGAYFSNYADIFNSVSKVQIQRGVGTSKNGVASFGGSIQLFSPNLRDSTEGNIGLGYGSFNSLRAFASYNSGLKNRKALYVRASQIYSDGYKYNSFNNSQSLFLSGALFFEKSVWKVNILAGHQQNGMAWLGVSDSLINVDPRTNVNAKQEKDQFFQGLAQVQNKWYISNSSSLHTSVYYTYLNGNYDFDFNNFLGFPSTDELYNYAFQSNLIGLFSNYTFSKKNLNWTTGIHGQVYSRKHLGSERNIGFLYENTGFKNEISVFTKVDYTFKFLHFFADIQYRYATFNYQGGTDLEPLNWQFLNPKGGISFSINPKALFYYSLGSTGREPTRNDMFGGNDDLLADSLGNSIVFNTNPEYVLNHELGFRYQAEKLYLNLNLYYMDFKNEIVLDGNFGPNGLALTNNVEQSFRMGVELTLNYRLSKHFTLVNNSSFNYSRIKEQNEVFSPILTPALIINQEIIFEHNAFTFALSGRYQQGAFIDFANENSLNSYFLLDARMSYTIKGFQLSIFANNITNATYFNNGYVDFDGTNKYFAQAPANVYAALKYTF
jgi:iron complex outermembrane receptor protein